MYWTDGNTVNVANMDGSNSKIIHQNQREPVGKVKESFVAIANYAKKTV